MASQPARPQVPLDRTAALHQVLGLEVRTRPIVRTDGVNDGQLFPLVQWQQGSQARMEPEKAVQVDRPIGVAGRPRIGTCDGQARSCRVVRLFAVRHNQVQPVRSAAQKNADQHVADRLAIAGGDGQLLGPAA